MQRLTWEKFFYQIDNGLHTLFPPQPRLSQRSSPAEAFKDDPETLTAAIKAQSARLMRVNHAGEVCAQALYQGQALTAKNEQVKAQMAEAAAEEIDHLAWCEGRLNELNSHSSLLNPLWYIGSLSLGILAGLAGDKWSLGFVAETEQQVSAHLEKHLNLLAKTDKKTELILQKMQEDEAQHALMAKQAGAKELPLFLKKMMQRTSKLMTWTSYYL